MKLTWFVTLESTQTFCIEALDAMGVFEVVVCNNQTLGIGTSGRSWVSIPESLCFSICLRCSAVADIALKISVCVKNVLEHKGVRGLRLKWPNDICIEDRTGLQKICGVLVNSFAAKSGACGEKSVTYVIGIGLNLAGSFAYSTLSDHGYALLKEDVLLGIVAAVRENILEKKELKHLETFDCFELGHLLFNGTKQDIVRVGDFLVLSENGVRWTATSRDFRYLPESNTLYAVGEEDRLT